MRECRRWSAFRRHRIVTGLAVGLAACAGGPDHDMVEAAAITGPDGTAQVVFVAERDVWEYDDAGVDLGTSWRLTSPSSTWAEGAGPLGYGEAYVVTTVSYGDDAADKHPTTYFRRGFDVVDPTKVRKLYLRAMFDDGFVFYLNGQEGGRAWMPSGTITYDTWALGHETGNNYMTFDVSAQIPNLVAGHNTIAVEVHQHDGRSSDLTMDMALIAFVDDDGSDPGDPYEPTDGGIPADSVWRYWNAGGDPGAAWREVDFDDGAWPAGAAPLGYGEPYIATELPERPITTYFRHAFTSDGAASAMSLEVAYDDGFVAYLNGVEIARGNMPSGDVTPTTLAHWREQPSGHPSAFYVLDHVAHLVRDGVNVLAVEVHQNAPTSSDLVWNARLLVEDDSPWRAVPSGTTDDLHDVAIVDRYHAIAVGDAGTVLRTTDGGETWWALDLGTTEHLRAIEIARSGPNAGDGFIVGDNGTVFETSNGGEDWTQRPVESSDVDFGSVSLVQGDVIHGVALVVAGLVPGGGTDGYFERTSSVEPFAHVPVAAGSAAILATSVDDVWLAWHENGETGGAIHHYDRSTGALTRKWSFGHHGVYPRAMTTQETATGTSLWMCGWRSAHLTGEVKLVSRDGGETWEMAPEATTRPLDDCAFGTDGLGVGVGIFGTIVMSTDGGETWTASQEREFHLSWDLLSVDVHDAIALAVGEHGTILKLDRSPDAPVPQFTRHPESPVLASTSDPEDLYAWDRGGPSSPTVVRMPDGTWTMIFATQNGTNASDRLGLATSPDGVHWTVDGPLAPYYRSRPTLVVAGDTYHLFATHLFDQTLGHYTSTDLSEWMHHGEIATAGDTAILHDGTQWVMWHSTFDGVMYGTSPDLMTWTFAPAPVFVIGPADPRNELSVRFDDGIYEMWFSRGGEGNVYYATSPDGLTWTERGVALVASPTGSFDEHIRGPYVVRDGDTLRMWYGGEGDDPVFGTEIGYATSP